MNKLAKVALKTKVGYGMGDLGFNIAVQATALVLLKFYTDTLLIGAEIAGIVILVSKIIDAITDPAMGMIADRTKSRWGRFRPYLLFGAMPFAISFFLLFNAPTAWPESARVIYAFVTYIVFCLMLTITNIPYSSMLPVLTNSADERVSLSSFKSVGGIIGVLLAAVAIESLVCVVGGGNDAAGYRIIVAGLAVIIAVTLLVCFKSTREDCKENYEVNLTVKQSFKLIAKNKPFLILCLGVLAIMTAVNTFAATVFFYFEYYLMEAGAGVIAFGGAFLAAIVAMPFLTNMSKHRSNRFVYIFGAAMMGVGLLGLFFVGTMSTLASILCFILVGVGLATNFLCPWAMTANTIEYSELTAGFRKEGTFYGVFFLVMKLSAALAGFIVGLVLGIGGYVPNLAQQAESARQGIRMLMTFIPMGFLVIGAITLMFFSITGKTHEQMVKEIAERDGDGRPR